MEDLSHYSFGATRWDRQARGFYLHLWDETGRVWRSPGVHACEAAALHAALPEPEEEQTVPVLCEWQPGPLDADGGLPECFPRAVKVRYLGQVYQGSIGLSPISDAWWIATLRVSDTVIKSRAAFGVPEIEETLCTLAREAFLES